MWLERVSSKANPSDETSRDEWLLFETYKWTHLEVDLTFTYKMLLLALQRPDLVHTTVAQEIHRDLHRQIAAQIPLPSRQGLEQTPESC
jgi:hypothetical protein